MKIVNEKRYVLSRDENAILNDFLNFLKANPLPCDECKAYKNGKCRAYTIWDTYDEDEICNDYTKWAKKVETLGVKPDLMQDDDFKNIIQSEYDLFRAEAQQEQVKTNYLIAKNKRDKACLIPKYSVDYGYRSEFENLWIIEEDSNLKGEEDND